MYVKLIHQPQLEIHVEEVLLMKMVKMTARLHSLKTNKQTTSTTSNDPTIPTPIHNTPDGKITQIFLGVTITML